MVMAIAVVCKCCVKWIHADKRVRNRTRQHRGVQVINASCLPFADAGVVDGELMNNACIICIPAGSRCWMC